MRDRIEQRAEAVSRLGCQLRNLLDQFGSRLTERARDDREEDQQADRSRQRRREMQLASHPRHEGLEQHGNRQRDGDGHDDDRQPGGAPQDGGDEAHDDQGAPRDRRGDAEGARDRVSGVLFILQFLAYGNEDGGGRRMFGVLRGQDGGKPPHQVGQLPARLIMCVGHGTSSVSSLSLPAWPRLSTLRALSERAGRLRW